MADSAAADLLDQLTASYEPVREARAKMAEIAIKATRALAREHAPTAVAVILDDSDQPGGVYVFSHFEDANGEEVEDIPVEVEDEIWRPISDLDESDVVDYRIEVEG